MNRLHRDRMPWQIYVKFRSSLRFLLFRAVVCDMAGQWTAESTIIAHTMSLGRGWAFQEIQEINFFCI
jgi:hypothetical protein